MSVLQDNINVLADFLLKEKDPFTDTYYREYLARDDYEGLYRLLLDRRPERIQYLVTRRFLYKFFMLLDHFNIFSVNCESLYIPDNYIDDYEFAGDKELTEIEIPSNIQVIDKLAFSGCINLKNVIFEPNSNLIDIGISAFDETAIETIELPESLQRLRPGAFEQCSQLKEIRIPSKIKWLENHLFAECSALERVWLPKSITTIEKNVFFRCKNLKEIIYDGVQADWENDIYINPDYAFNANNFKIKFKDGTEMTKFDFSLRNL